MDALDPILYKIQNELFVIGSRLATPPGPMETKIASVSQEAIDFLEKGMDILSTDLPPLTRFILPGGSTLAAELHLGRTVCRRAERLIITLSSQGEIDPLIIKYVNRLSDFLFVAARWACLQQGEPEVFWEK